MTLWIFSVVYCTIYCALHDQIDTIQKGGSEEVRIIATLAVRSGSPHPIPQVLQVPPREQITQVNSLDEFPLSTDEHIQLLW